MGDVTDTRGPRDVSGRDAGPDHECSADCAAARPGTGAARGAEVDVEALAIPDEGAIAAPARRLPGWQGGSDVLASRTGSGAPRRHG